MDTHCTSYTDRYCFSRDFLYYCQVLKIPEIGDFLFVIKEDNSHNRNKLLNINYVFDKIINFSTLSLTLFLSMKQYLILSILMCISACGAPISDPVPTPVPNTVSDDCKNTPLFEGYSHTYAFSPDRVTCFVLHVAETHNDMFLPHFLLVSHSNTHG